MSEVPQLAYSVGLDYPSLQGETVGNSTVLTEIVALIPYPAPKVNLWSYVLLTEPASISAVISGISFAFSITTGTGLLIETNGATYTPSVLQASARSRNLVVLTNADGTSTDHNVVKGQGRVAVCQDFTGDLYNKVANQPNPTGKDVFTGPAQLTFGMMITDDMQYERYIQRVKLSLNYSQFAVDSIYLIGRKEHLTQMSLTVPVGYSVVKTSLDEGDGHGLKMPAYAMPFIETGDNSIAVFHIVMQFSAFGVILRVKPNRSSDLYAAEQYDDERSTWLASIVYSPQGTGSEYPMYTTVNWEPRVTYCATSPARITAFKGLNGNRITVRASGVNEAPVQCANPLTYSAEFKSLLLPDTVVAEANELMNADSEKRKVYISAFDGAPAFISGKEGEKKRPRA